MTTMTVIAGVFILLGAGFVAIAALGIVRLSDIYLRMHSLAKAGTLGVGLVLTGAAFALPSVGVVVRAIGAIAFLVVTAPLASHLIGRAAHRTGVPQCASTVMDEWKEDRSES